VISLSQAKFPFSYTKSIEILSFYLIWKEIFTTTSDLRFRFRILRSEIQIDPDTYKIPIR
ncbi:unnamed protein product, partial [Arabidopsis halleri]